MCSLTFGSKTVNSKTVSRGQAPCHCAWGSQVGDGVQATPFPRGKQGLWTFLFPQAWHLARGCGVSIQMETAGTELGEMTCEPSSPEWHREKTEKMIQGICADQRADSLQEANQKAQQREPEGLSHKRRREVLTGKASQSLTGKGIGKVTNLCTRGANHNKNYLSELKGQWDAAGQAAKSLWEEHGIDGWKAGSKQPSLRGALGQWGVTQGLQQLGKLLSGLKWVLQKGPAYEHTGSKFLMVSVLLAFSRQAFLCLNALWCLLWNSPEGTDIGTSADRALRVLTSLNCPYQASHGGPTHTCPRTLWLLFNSNPGVQSLSELCLWLGQFSAVLAYCLGLPGCSSHFSCR